MWPVGLTAAQFETGNTIVATDDLALIALIWHSQSLKCQIPSIQEDSVPRAQLFFSDGSVGSKCFGIQYLHCAASDTDRCG